jgi:hypothetical protein
LAAGASARVHPDLEAIEITARRRLFALKRGVLIECCLTELGR